MKSKIKFLDREMDAAGRKLRPNIRFPLITIDAEKLGVTRIHLWYVLTGRRHSPGLLKRYQQLQRRAA